MAESDPTRELLTAARKLAACEHRETISVDAATGLPVYANAFLWNLQPGGSLVCADCGAVGRLVNTGAGCLLPEWRRPRDVSPVVDAIGRIPPYIERIPADVVARVVASAPSHDLLVAARTLAGCQHDPSKRIRISLTDNGGRSVSWGAWCADCGSILDAYEPTRGPVLALDVVDAARELDSLAANVAHAEAHAPPAMSAEELFRVGSPTGQAMASLERQTGGRFVDVNAQASDVKRFFDRYAYETRHGTEAGGDLVLDEFLARGDERLANLLAGARKLARETVDTIGAAARAANVPLAQPYAPADVTVATTVDIELPPDDPARLRYRLDAAAVRLRKATELVRALDQVDPRTFGADAVTTLDEVRTTARARMRDAAGAYVRASDELYAADVGERAGAEP